MSAVTRNSVAGRAYLDLQRLGRKEKRPTDELIQLYVLEGFLERMAASAQAKDLVLKGGVLLAAYAARRPTRDIDLAGQNLSNDTQSVLTLVRSILGAPIDDGWSYGEPSVEVIRPDDKYSGVRVTVPATLAAARVSFDVDVSVGDPVWPAPAEVLVPRLLGGAVKVPGYPLSMVYAEKLVTAVQRGIANTRWRDFADVYLLSNQHESHAAELRESIARVAGFRQVRVSPLSIVLDGFADLVQPKWAIWSRKQRLEDRLPKSFAEVLARVFAFADPIIEGAVTESCWIPSIRTWSVKRQE